MHHLIGKEIIRFHCVWWPAMCMAAGIDPPAHIQVHGWLLLGGEKMSNSSVNQITPGELIAEYGVDPVRYHLLRDTPLGSDGDFSYEGITARYNADLANNLGNLLSRVATVVGSKCGGTGPGRRPTAAWPAWPPPWWPRPPRRWDAGQPHPALEATWRLIRETNAELEATEPWKADPGPAVDVVTGQRPRGAAHRLDPHRPGHAGHRPGDLAPDRARGVTRPTSACRQPDPGAAIPAGARWRRAPRCSPGARASRGDPVDDAVIEWFDSHCHLQDEFADDRCR